MNMQENARLILGLRAKGWTDTEINDLVLWIETGNEKYNPEKEVTKKGSTNHERRHQQL